MKGKAGAPRRSYHQRRKKEQAARLQRELERAWLAPRYAEITTEAELIAAVGGDGMKFTQALRERMK